MKKLLFLSLLNLAISHNQTHAMETSNKTGKINPAEIAQSNDSPQIPLNINKLFPQEETEIDVALETMPTEVNTLIACLKKEKFSESNPAPAVLFCGKSDQSLYMPYAVAKKLNISYSSLNTFSNRQALHYPLGLAKPHAIIIKNIHTLFSEYKSRHTELKSDDEISTDFVNFLKSVQTCRTFLFCGLPKDLVSIPRSLRELFVSFRAYRTACFIPQLENKELWLVLNSLSKKYGNFSFYKRSYSEHSYPNIIRGLEVKKILIQKLQQAKIPLNFIPKIISKLVFINQGSNYFKPEFWALTEYNFDITLSNAQENIKLLEIENNNNNDDDDACESIAKECIICKEEKITYYETPCCSQNKEEKFKKIICNTCITNWLGAQNSNTCPNCRAEITLKAITTYTLQKQ